MTEAELQARVQDRLTADGWRWHHCCDSRHCDGLAGFPDLLAIRRGRLVVAELKSEEGRNSREQLDWHAAFRMAGIPMAAEIRPSTWQEWLRHVNRL